MTKDLQFLTHSEFCYGTTFSYRCLKIRTNWSSRFFLPPSQNVAGFLHLWFPFAKLSWSLVLSVPCSLQLAKMSAVCVPLGGEQFAPHCYPAMILSPFLVAVVVVFASAVTGCPVLCTCRSQVVDCSGLRLFSVPPDLPLDTRNLSLAHNRITAIPPGYLTCYSELRVLDLRNNSLIELPAGLFLTTKRLSHLDLSYNNLTQVAADMFHEAYSLVQIDLSHNPWLRKVHPQAFRGLAHLRDLDLSYGGLTFLSLEALEGLTGLVSLQIGGNPWVCGCTMEPLLKWLRNRIQRCMSGRWNQAMHTSGDFLKSHQAHRQRKSLHFCTSFHF